VGTTRFTNLKHPLRYSEAVEAGAPLWCESEEVDEEKQRMERIMLGLRLNEGLLEETLGVPPETLASLSDRGWIERSSGRVALTPAGRHWCSEATLTLI
jgi:oxygen-independent coproporphyrinogen III oxidase